MVMGWCRSLFLAALEGEEEDVLVLVGIPTVKAAKRILIIVLLALSV